MKSKFRWQALECIRAYFSRTLTWIPSSLATVIQLTRWLCSLAMALYLAHRFCEWVTIRSRSEAVETTMADRWRFLGPTPSPPNASTPPTGVPPELGTEDAPAKVAAGTILLAATPGLPSSGLRWSPSTAAGFLPRPRPRPPARVISMGTRFEATSSAALRRAASFCSWANRSRSCRCSSLRVRFSSRAFSRATFSACFCFWRNSRSRCRASFLSWERRRCSRLAFWRRSCSRARSADLACCWALVSRAWAVLWLAAKTWLLPLLPAEAPDELSDPLTDLWC
mmetsp:Transcript_11601/g.33388  ORF Transcript_11601/g.33388 Transcript_11601/m.33388 type:complete len:282 (+) Transcript_11601:1003-1848(+)